MVMVSTYLRSAKNIDDAEAKALEDIFEAAYNRLVTKVDEEMPDELRRGFKSEAEALAQLVRAELGLGVLDRLDCYVLAETWGIPIVTLGSSGGWREGGVDQAPARPGGRLLRGDGLPWPPTANRLQPAALDRADRELARPRALPSHPGARARAPRSG